MMLRHLRKKFTIYCKFAGLQPHASFGNMPDMFRPLALICSLAMCSCQMLPSSQQPASAPQPRPTKKMDLAEAKPLAVTTAQPQALATDNSAATSETTGAFPAGDTSTADNGLIPAANSIPKVIRPAGCMEPDVTATLPLSNAPSAQ